ncbi:MAG: RIP metalloprotease RseP [Candidatus Magasanikbacteria bacterium]|nr:RIP metalloprotease RseP [Candidatus Magasanikbacteria bacterium]
MLSSFFGSVLPFIGLLFVLVIAHEWGHFFMARRFGVRVFEFGFGFPPKIKGWMRRGTEYTANWIPLGGFVRLKGEDGSDTKDADSFAHKKVWQRLVILLAGVAMNFIVGYIIFVGVFAYGVEMPKGDADAGAIFSNERVMVDAVLPDSPAVHAGMKAGDVITAIDGTIIAHASEVPPVIKKNAGAVVAVTFVRDGKTETIAIVPAKIAPDVVGIGVSVFDYAHVRYPFPIVFVKAGQETLGISTLIFKTMGTIVGTLFHTGKLQEGVSGPVGIAVVTGQVAREGWIPFLQLMAMLSINLGVLNILPIPALDGGRALFVIIESVSRRKVRAELEGIIHTVGFVLLMLLVIAVTYRDIVGLLK